MGAGCVALLTLTDLTVLTAFLFSSVLSTLVMVVRGSPVREVIVLVQIPASVIGGELARLVRAFAASSRGRTVVPGVLDLLKHHLFLPIHRSHPGRSINDEVSSTIKGHPVLATTRALDSRLCLILADEA